jgi:hypothetical protein
MQKIISQQPNFCTWEADGYKSNYYVLDNPSFFLDQYVTHSCLILVWWWVYGLPSSEE